MLLGVLFHTSIVYAPEIGYAIKNPERNYFFSVIVHFIHVFRMPLFFFLSGFFSFMVLNKHGGRNFTFSRFERMFAPMIVGLLFFSPIQYFIVYNQKNNPISFLEYYPLFFTPNEFDLSHIWFLVYLFLFSFLLLLNHKFHIGKLLAKILFKNSFLNKIIQFKKTNSLNLFIRFVFLSFASIYLINFLFNKDDSFLRIQPVSFIYYLSFFLIGVYAYKNEILQNPDITFGSKLKPIFRLIRFIVLFLIYLYLNETDPYWMSFAYDSKRILWRGVHLLIDSSLAWILIFELAPFFKRYLDHTGPILDHLRNSGMSVYLIHHPISLLIGYFLLSVEISVFVKFSIHTISVYFLSFFFYYYVIKKSFILNRVFGTK